jgi:glycosyltransferase involved in cell wall biosynthesis
MAKIILIGNVLPPVIYQQWLDAGEVIDPSHQLFFSRLVDGIANHQSIQVLSLPPVKKTTSKRFMPESIYRLGQIVYIQFPFMNQRWLRSMSLSIQIHRYLKQSILRSSPDVILLIDGSSRLARSISTRYQHHPQVRTIGIFIDSPTQTSELHPRQVRRWSSLHQHHHAYIGVTPTLLKEYNRLQKPQFELPCLVDAIEGAKQHNRPYFFFSGALDERYGVESMIHAFLQLKQKNFDLLIAGFGPFSQRIEQLSQQHRNIKFLGLMNPTLTRKYHVGAYVNLNPRPLDSTLDQVSIPSKVMDYISSGSPTLTTRHPWIEAQFGDNVQYIDDASVEGMQLAIKQFLQSDYSVAQTKAIRAKKIALQKFGKEKIGYDLVTWMNDLK